MSWFPGCLRKGNRYGCIGLTALVQRPQGTRDAGVDLLHPPGDLADSVILVAIVHRCELAPIDGNNGATEEVGPSAKRDELPADRPDRRAIVLAEAGSCLESGPRL